VQSQKLGVVPKSFKRFNVVSLLGELVLVVSLGMLPSSYFAIPYIALFLAICIAVIVMLVIFPSFRKYRRKRNILIYIVAALVLMLLIFQIDNVTRRAVVSYKIDTSVTQFYPDETNQIRIRCQNHGDRPASFYLDFHSINASFSAQPEQTYIQVSTTLVVVPFMLQESWFSTNTVSKPVFFNIDANVTEFSFDILFEVHGYNNIAVSEGVTNIRCVWNETQNCYTLEGVSGFIV